MTGAAAAATAYWFGRGLQPAMPGVQSVQPDAGSLFRRTIHNASRLPVKRHRGSRDTHGTHKRTRGHTDHRDEPHKQPNPATSTHPHDQTRQPKPETGNGQTAADSTAARTAAGPEPTTPRGRLRRGRANPTTCLHPQPVHACVCKTRCIRHAYRYLPVIYTKHAPKRRAHPARAAAIRRPRKLVFLDCGPKGVALRPSLTFLAFLVHLRAGVRAAWLAARLELGRATYTALRRLRHFSHMKSLDLT